MKLIYTDENSVKTELVDDIGIKDFVEAVKSDEDYGILEMKVLPPAYEGKLIESGKILEISVALISGTRIEYTSSYTIRQRMDPKILEKLELTQAYFDNGIQIEDAIRNLYYLFEKRPVFALWPEYYEACLVDEMEKNEVMMFWNIPLYSGNLLCKMAFGSYFDEHQIVKSLEGDKKNNYVFEQIIRAKESLKNSSAFSTDSQLLRDCYMYRDIYVVPKKNESVETIDKEFVKAIPVSSISSQNENLFLIFEPKTSLIKMLIACGWATKFRRLIQNIRVMVLPNIEAVKEIMDVDYDGARRFLNELEKYCFGYGVLVLYND